MCLAVAEAVATATVEAFAATSSNCNEAVAAAKAADTKTTIATAIAESYAGACSTGGTASASSEVVATAVATATASAYVEALAAVSGPCGGCGASKPAGKSPAAVQEPLQPATQPEVKASPPAGKPETKISPPAPHNRNDDEGNNGNADDEDLDTEDSVGEVFSHDDDAHRTSISTKYNTWHSTHKERKYKACHTWLRDDCCSGRATNRCHCFSFSGLRR